jgi:hypothetical protein
VSNYPPRACQFNIAALKLILSLGSPLTSPPRSRLSVLKLKLVEDKVSYYGGEHLWKSVMLIPPIFLLFCSRSPLLNMIMMHLLKLFRALDVKDN